MKKCAGGFSRWKEWATKTPGIKVFPAKPFQFALYLAFLIQSSKTSAPVKKAVNSISWTHQLAVVEYPADHPLVRQILAGAKCILTHRTMKKEPITPEILHGMFGMSLRRAAYYLHYDDLPVGLCWTPSFQRIGISEGM